MVLSSRLYMLQQAFEEQVLKSDEGRHPSGALTVILARGFTKADGASPHAWPGSCQQFGAKNVMVEGRGDAQ